MPQIVEYENPIKGLDPSDRGTQAYAQMGRRVGSFYHQLGETIGNDIDQYEQHQAQQEVSQGFATSAKIMNGLTNNWETTAKNADPNDPSTAEKWRQETLEPQLKEWVSQFKTKQGQLWATEHAATLRQHFFEKSAVDQSNIAGDAVVSNYKVGVNQYASAVFQDPSNKNLGVALGTLSAGIDAMVSTHPQLTAEQASKAKTDLLQKGRTSLVQSSVLGYADAGMYAQARQRIDDPAYAADLSTEERETLRGHVNTQERLGQEAAKSAQAQQQKQEDEAFHGAVAKVQSGMYQSDGSLRVPPDFFKSLGQLTLMPGGQRHPEELRALADAGSTALKNQIDHTYQQSDPTTYMQLAGRVGLPVAAGGLSAVDVSKAYATGRLSDHDMTKLNDMIEKVNSDPAEKELAKRRTEFLDSVKTIMGKTGPLGTFLQPETAARFYQFQTDTQAREDQLRSSGKSPADIMNSLYNPRDAAYQGTRVGAYTLTTKEGLAAASAAAAGHPQYTNPPAPDAIRREGEYHAPLGATNLLVPGQAQSHEEAFKQLSPAQQAWIKAHP